MGKTWLAAHLVSDDVAFGRLNSMADHNSNLVISHWTPNFAHLNGTSSSNFRLHDLRLSPCAGCSLNDPSIPLNLRSSLKSSNQIPCCFYNANNRSSIILDGPTSLDPNLTVAAFKQPAFHYQNAARLLPLTPTLPPQLPCALPDPLTSALVSHPLYPKISSHYRSNTVISTLIPLASHLMHLSLSQPLVFYTDSAFARASTNSNSVTGSGFVAVSSSALLSSRLQLSFDCSHWPSAYKAEVMALFVLLTILPDFSSCTIYSDCQTLISTFHEVIFNLAPSKNFKRPMFPIWNLIATWVHNLHLKITLLKVKGHSNDAYNKHADELAKNALTSPSFTLRPNDLWHNTVALPRFRISSDSAQTLDITLEHNPRFFVKDIHQAANFSRFLALNRFSSLQPLLPLIDWDYTWFCLNFDPFSPRHHTSFEMNSALAWSSKLLLEELPLLATLQIRKPEVYKSHWNCVSCQQAPETWSHLWSCIHTLPKLEGLRDFTRFTLFSLLENHDRLPSTGLSSANRFDINSLDCWLMSESTTAIHFDLFIREFISTDLISVVKSIVRTQEHSRTLIAETLFIAQKAFKEQIWSERCVAFAAFEKDNNITEKMKKLPSTASSIRSPPSRMPVLSDNTTWIDWISQMVTTGLPWLGFRTRINSLILWS